MGTRMADGMGKFRKYERMQRSYMIVATIFVLYLLSLLAGCSVSLSTANEEQGDSWPM